MSPALFVDRDGVINRMVHYPSGWDSPQNIQDVKLVPGIETIISWANENNIRVIEVSNQPGVAKGKMSEHTAAQIEQEIHNLLHKKNAKIDASYICPHHENAIVPHLRVNCDCRKPNPGLILKASKDIKIDLKQSVFIGDKATDIIAGQSAGVITILFKHSEDEEEKISALDTVSADYTETSMDSILALLQKLFKSA